MRIIEHDLKQHLATGIAKTASLSEMQSCLFSITLGSALFIIPSKSPTKPRGKSYDIAILKRAAISAVNVNCLPEKLFSEKQFPFDTSLDTFDYVPPVRSCERTGTVQLIIDTNVTLLTHLHRIEANVIVVGVR